MKDINQTSQIASKPARQKKIIELIQKHGYVRVLDLSKSLNVAEITVRRDLDLLEKEHILERTHGGAIFTKSLHKETDFRSRSDLELENKDLIAREAAKLICDGDTIFINGGSTTYHIFKYITNKNVKIVTTNASCLGQINNPEIELILAGGLYYPQSNSFYGGFTNNILSQINGSKAILGVHGISCRYGITTPMQHAAETYKIMMDRTMGDVIIVADHRKIGLISDFVTAPVNRINTLITDWFLDKEYIRDFEDLGIKVIQTKPIE